MVAVLEPLLSVAVITMVLRPLVRVTDGTVQLAGVPLTVAPVQAGVQLMATLSPVPPFEVAVPASVVRGLTLVPGAVTRCPSGTSTGAAIWTCGFEVVVVPGSGIESLHVPRA
jgi:hypothetical protein